MSKIEKLAKIEYPQMENRFNEEVIDHQIYMSQERRKAYIKGYEKANEWVSVHHMSPEEDYYYLVYEITFGMITRALFSCGEFFPVENMSEKLQITHWKELPTPPKQ